MKQNFKIRPAVKDFFRRLILLSLICTVFSVIVAYIADGRLYLSLVFGIPLICVGVVSILALPLMIFSRLEIKQNVVISKFFLRTKEMNIQDIDSIEEYRGRRNARHMVLKSRKDKIQIPYRLFSEEDLRSFIKELLERDSSIKNHFDVVK